jgi:hypothetical protein
VLLGRTVAPSAKLAAGVGDARQNGIVSNPELITAVDLDQWSGTLAAQTTLPILVRRLILATAPVNEITMRAREGALLPGWDGIVRFEATDPHVPSGTSGWELGTSNDPRKKAQSDFRIRTKDPLGLDPKTTTFVAVTSRSSAASPATSGRPTLGGTDGSARPVSSFLAASSSLDAMGSSPGSGTPSARPRGRSLLSVRPGRSRSRSSARACSAPATNSMSCVPARSSCPRPARGTGSSTRITPSC